MRLVVCALIFSALVLGGMGWGDFPLEAFFDLPSLILVLGGAVCGTVAVHPVADVSKAFRLALSDKPSEAFPEGRAVFQDASIFSAAAGLLGTLIGLVKMLLWLDDPSAIGPSFAVALLTIVYGIIFSQFVFLPLGNRLQDPDPNREDSEGLKRRSVQGYASLGLLVFGAGVLFLTLLLMVFVAYSF